MGESMNTQKDLAAVPFAKVLTRDTEKHVKSVLVPGSECKTYLVILRRDGTLSTECLLRTPVGDIPCQGNSKTLCYHSRAALRVAAGVRRIHFCELWTDAERLSHTGGKVAKVTSRQSSKEVWMVVK